MLAANVSEITAFNLSPLNAMKIDHTERIEKLGKAIAELKKDNLNFRGMTFHQKGIIGFCLNVIIMQVRR